MLELWKDCPQLVRFIVVSLYLALTTVEAALKQPGAFPSAVEQKAPQEVPHSEGTLVSRGAGKRDYRLFALAA